MNKVNFQAKNELGVLTNYEVVATLDSEDGTKKYICYTDNVKENDKNRVFLSKYEEQGDDIKIFPIEDNEEWKWVVNHFKTINKE